MQKTLRILLVEDSEDDALLTMREVERGGKKVQFQRLETAEAMKDALKNKMWDIVIADYRLPHFSAPEALQVLKKSGIDLPFIVVSGTIGEETAVEVMKAGAHDYLMKDNLKRLVPTIEREIRELDVRKKRRKAEKALHESEEYLHILMDSIKTGILVIDAVTHKITDANNFALEMIGLEKNKVIGKICHKFICEAEQGYCPITDLKHEFELSDQLLLTKNNGEIPILKSAVPITRAGKKYLVESFVEITQLKLTERALRDSEERLQIMFQSVSEGIIVTDPKGKLIEANEATVKIQGYDNKNELLGRNILDLVVDINRLRVKKNMEMILATGKSCTIECMLLRKDGSEFIGLFSTSLIKDVSGKPEGLVYVIVDITERKAMEEKLIITDRLASIGELAAGIAHEVNNPLTSVIGFSQLLLEEDMSDDAKNDIKIIYSEAQRAAQVVKNLLTFARKQTSTRHNVSVNSIIEKVLEIRAYEQNLGNIQVITKFTQDSNEIEVDSILLQQVFLNIIINAEYFMIKAHNKGTLIIDTERVGGIIRTTFTDDGIGISKENIKQIFNPFFTTKEVGKGTGLGLSICHGIVSEHGGSINAESKLGEGTTFIVELPCSTKAERDQIDETAVDEIEEYIKAKILIVDDESSIRELLSRVLTEVGHEVDCAENATVAQEKIENKDYDLILLDIKMPGISGIELYERNLGKRQSLANRVLFITGDIMGEEIKEFISRTKAPYLSKPLDIEKLKKVMNRHLSN